MKMLSFLLLMLCFGFGQAQKTYFIETERKTQNVYIDGVEWDKESFFTVNPSDGYHQIIIKEKGYKNQFAILKEGVHEVFTTTQKIVVDTIILSQVKPIELNFSEDAKITTYDVDYISYMKDINYVGEISNAYNKSKNEDIILEAIDPKNQYLINELNEYHDMTRGRYQFYSLGSIKSLELYEVTLDDQSKFVQAKVNVDWSITRKTTKDLPQYNFNGMSGKIIYDPEAKTQDSAINAVIHDALFSSLISFLEDQEMRLKKSM